MFTCAILCWLHSCDWIEWHDLCRKNDRIVWTLDQQPFTLICSIAKSSPLFQQHHFTPLKSSLDVFYSKLCDKWELSSKQPESCKMLRRLSSTPLHYSKCTLKLFEAFLLWQNLSTMYPCHFQRIFILLWLPCALFHIFAFAAKVFVTWRFLVE